MKGLFEKTIAYKIISEDKKNGRLSHSYLLSVEDGDLLDEYLKQAAKLIACDKEGFDGTCRVCRLIDANMHPDVTFYPKDKKLSVADADDLVEQSVVRPLELDKRIFVVSRPETLNQNQNKLLKTVEEPPRNVYVLLGAEKPSAILPTIRSRAKNIFVPIFSVEELLNITKDEYPDRKRAVAAALMSGGKAGVMDRRYNDETTLPLLDVCLAFMSEALSARDIPAFIARFAPYKNADIISTLIICINEIIRVKLGASSLIEDERIQSIASAYETGALVAVNEKLCALEKQAYYNGNATMIKDSALFAVLKERAKWHRLSE